MCCGASTSRSRGLCRSGTFARRARTHSNNGWPYDLRIVWKQPLRNSRAHFVHCGVGCSGSDVYDRGGQPSQLCGLHPNLPGIGTGYGCDTLDARFGQTGAAVILHLSPCSQRFCLCIGHIHRDQATTGRVGIRIATGCGIRSDAHTDFCSYACRTLARSKLTGFTKCSTLTRDPAAVATGAGVDVGHCPGDCRVLLA